MPLQIPGDSAGPDSQVTLNEGDSLLLRAGTSVVSTGGLSGVAVFAASPGFHILQIDGVISGHRGGILCGVVGVDGPAYVSIGATGQVMGSAASADSFGVALQARGSVLENWGSVSGFWGVILAADASATWTPCRIVNAGTIHGTEAAIYREGGGASQERLEIFNSGSLMNGAGSAIVLSNTLTSTHLVNSGLIKGAISFGNGDDVYDGVRGRIIEAGRSDARIESNGGAIRIHPGFSHERFLLSEASDVHLDFSKGPAVKLALDESFAATSVAAGDTYQGTITTLTGSRGADVFRGNAAGNWIEGGGGGDLIDGAGGNDSLWGDEGRGLFGHDTLRGGDGDDKINGAFGRDVLFGGAGDDIFVWGIGDGADAIGDFSNATGNNDVIWLNVSGFGFPMTDRYVTADEFLITRGNNRAQDREDRLIFDTATTRLWIDPDGTGRRPPVLIADFAPGVRLTMQDLYVTLGS